MPLVNILMKTGCSIWNCPPRNPSCGLFSAGRGALIFLYTYTIIYACFSAFLGACMVLFLILAPSPRDLHKASLGMASSSDDERDAAVRMISQHFGESRDTAVKIDALLELHFDMPLMIFIIIIKAIIAFAAWTCRQAMISGMIPKMKKRFYLLVAVILVNMTYQLIWGILYSSVTIFFLVKIPLSMISVMGLLLTYSHILSFVHVTTINSGTKLNSVGEQVQVVDSCADNGRGQTTIKFDRICN